MQFAVGNGYINLPSLPVTIGLIVIIYLLMRWSKELKASEQELQPRRFTIVLYFLVSTFVAPLYTRGTENGVFELFVPVGFIVVLIYLYGNGKYHPAKLKASILGLLVAIYQLVYHYIGYF